MKPSFAAPRPSFIPPYRFQTEVRAAYLTYLQNGTVSLRSLQHVDKFVYDCKEAGLYSKLTYLMCFVGTTLASGAPLVELINGTTNSAVNFVAGDYDELTGLTGNGSTKYLHLAVAADVLFPATGHMAFYQRTDNAAATSMMMGAADGTDEFWMAGSSTATATRYGKATSCSVASQATKAFYYAQRISATDLKLYKNGIQIATLATSVTPVGPAQTVFGWAYNANGTPANHTAMAGSFLSIGALMTTAEQLVYYGLVQTLQTNLGRNV